MSSSETGEQTGRTPAVLTAQHFAAPGHLLVLAVAGTTIPVRVFISSSLSSPYSTTCSSKPIQQTDIENKLKQRLFSGSSYIVFHQLLLYSLLILATTSCNLRLIFQAMPFQHFHFLGSILNYHANLVFQRERS